MDDLLQRYTVRFLKKKCTVNYDGNGLVTYVQKPMRKYQVWRRDEATENYFAKFALIDAIARCRISRHNKGSTKPIYFEDEIIPFANLSSQQHKYVHSTLRVEFKDTSPKAGMRHVVVNGRPKLMRADCRDDEAKVYVHLDEETGTIKQVYVRMQDDQFYELDGTHFSVRQQRLNEMRNYIVTLAFVPWKEVRTNTKCASFRNCARHQCITENCERNLFRIMRTMNPTPVHLREFTIPEMVPVLPEEIEDMAALETLEAMLSEEDGLKLRVTAFRKPVPTTNSFAIAFENLKFDTMHGWFKTKLSKYLSELHPRIETAFDTASEAKHVKPGVTCTIDPPIIVRVSTPDDSTLKVSDTALVRHLKKQGEIDGKNLGDHEIFPHPEDGFVALRLEAGPENDEPMLDGRCEELYFYKSKVDPLKEEVRLEINADSKPMQRAIWRTLQQYDGFEIIKWDNECEWHLPKHVILEAPFAVWRPRPTEHPYVTNMVRTIAQSKDKHRMLVDLDIHERRLAALMLIGMIRCGLRKNQSWVNHFKTDPIVFCSNEEKQVLIEFASLYHWSNSTELELADYIRKHHVSSEKQLGDDRPVIAIDKDVPFFESSDRPIILCVSDFATAIKLEQKHEEGNITITFNGAAVHTQTWYSRVTLQTLVLTCDKENFWHTLEKRMRSVLGNSNEVVVHTEREEFQQKSLGDFKVQSLEDIRKKAPKCKFIVCINPASMAELTQLYSCLVAPNYIEDTGKLLVQVVLWNQADQQLPFYTTKEEMDQFLRKANIPRNQPKSSFKEDRETCEGYKPPEPLLQEPSWYEEMLGVKAETRDMFMQACGPENGEQPIFKGKGLTEDIDIKTCDPFRTGSSWSIYEVDMFTEDEAKALQCEEEEEDGNCKRFAADLKSAHKKQTKWSEYTRLDANQFETMINHLGQNGKTIDEETSAKMMKYCREVHLPITNKYMYTKSNKASIVEQYEPLKPCKFQIALAASALLSKRTLIASTTGTGKTLIYQMILYAKMINRQNAKHGAPDEVYVVITPTHQNANDQARRFKTQFPNLDGKVEVLMGIQKGNTLKAGHIYFISPDRFVYFNWRQFADGFNLPKNAKMGIIYDEAHNLIKIEQKSGKESTAKAPQGSEIATRRDWLEFFEDETATENSLLFLVGLTATPFFDTASKTERFVNFWKTNSGVLMYYNGMSDATMPRLSVPPEDILIDVKGEADRVLGGNEELRLDRGLCYKDTSVLGIPENVKQKLVGVLNGKQKRTLIVVEGRAAAFQIANALRDAKLSRKVLCMTKTRKFDGENWYKRTKKAKIDDELGTKEINSDQFGNLNLPVMSNYKRTERAILVISMIDYGEGFDFDQTELLIRVPFINQQKEEQMQGRVTRFCLFPNAVSLVNASGFKVEHMVIHTQLTTEMLYNQYMHMLQGIKEKHTKFRDECDNRAWIDDKQMDIIFGRSPKAADEGVQVAFDYSPKTETNAMQLTKFVQPADDMLRCGNILNDEHQSVEEKLKVFLNKDSACLVKAYENNELRAFAIICGLNAELKEEQYLYFAVPDNELHKKTTKIPHAKSATIKEMFGSTARQGSEWNSKEGYLESYIIPDSVKETPIGKYVVLDFICAQRNQQSIGKILLSKILERLPPETSLIAFAAKHLPPKDEDFGDEQKRTALLRQLNASLNKEKLEAATKIIKHAIEKLEEVKDTRRMSSRTGAGNVAKEFEAVREAVQKYVHLMDARVRKNFYQEFWRVAVDENEYAIQYISSDNNDDVGKPIDDVPYEEARCIRHTDVNETITALTPKPAAEDEFAPPPYKEKKKQE